MLSVPGSYRNWRGWDAVPLGIRGRGGICWSVLYLSQSGDRFVCNGGRGRCKCFQNGNGLGNSAHINRGRGADSFPGNTVGFRPARIVQELERACHEHCDQNLRTIARTWQRLVKVPLSRQEQVQLKLSIGNRRTSWHTCLAANDFFLTYEYLWSERLVLDPRFQDSSFLCVHHLERTWSNGYGR